MSADLRLCNSIKEVCIFIDDAIGHGDFFQAMEILNDLRHKDLSVFGNYESIFTIIQIRFHYKNSKEDPKTSPIPRVSIYLDVTLNEEKLDSSLVFDPVTSPDRIIDSFTWNTNRWTYEGHETINYYKHVGVSLEDTIYLQLDN